MSDAGAASGAGGVMGMVESLRAALVDRDGGALAAGLSRLDGLETALSRVLAEHSGMADELLRVYEQLGIVFEVTRRLPSVQNEDQVLGLFVESLRPTYPTARVHTVRHDATERLVVCEEGVVRSPWVHAALGNCRDLRRVVVVDAPREEQQSARSCPEAGGGHNALDSFSRVLCAPVYAGDDFVCALLLGHDASVDPVAQPRSFDASDMLLLESLSVFCGDMIRNLRLLNELRQLSVDMVRALINAIEQKDEYTSGHSTRVGVFARLLGREVGLDAEALQMLEWSALLHDIGKIGIRDEVLKKPGRLTDEEFEHIKEHPRRSYEVVHRIPQLAAALDGVVHHHEHWDGSGYPDGLAGEAIPLQARIIQVADIFDALTSTRSYRQAFTWEKALGILREEAGRTVDPGLSSAFERLIRHLAEDDPEQLRQIFTIRPGASGQGPVVNEGNNAAPTPAAACGGGC